MNSGNQFIWSFVKKYFLNTWRFLKMTKQIKSSFTHRAFAENKLRVKQGIFSTSKKLTDRPV